MGKVEARQDVLTDLFHTVWMRDRRIVVGAGWQDSRQSWAIVASVGREFLPDSEPYGGAIWVHLIPTSNLKP
jgi:hypothetical protein